MNLLHKLSEGVNFSSLDKNGSCKLAKRYWMGFVWLFIGVLTVPIVLIVLALMLNSLYRVFLGGGEGWLVVVSGVVYHVFSVMFILVMVGINLKRRACLVGIVFSYTFWICLFFSSWFRNSHKAPGEILENKLIRFKLLDLKTNESMFKTQIGDQPILCFVDTGSTHSFLAYDTAKRLKLSLKGPSALAVYSLGLSYKKAWICEPITLQFGDINLDFSEFYIIDYNHPVPSNENACLDFLTKVDFVIGNDILQRYNAIIDYSGRNVIFSQIN